MDKNTRILPSTIFVFDLHGVIFKLSPLQIIKEIIKCPYKLKLLTLIFYPKILIKTINELRNGAIAEEILFKLSKDFPQYYQLLPTGFNIINSQKPLKKTIQAIKKLKLKGHQIYILSNIGEKSMDIMKEKFPDVFSNFDGVFASSANDGYLKKPSPKSFEKYLKQFNQKAEDIIFIDDRIKNITAAQSLNIPTILFKDENQFYKKLNDLKIID